MSKLAFDTLTALQLIFVAMAFAARAQSALQASVAPSDAVVSAKADTAQLSAAIDKGLEEVRVERVRVDGLVRDSPQLLAVLWHLACHAAGTCQSQGQGRVFSSSFVACCEQGSEMAAAMLARRRGLVMHMNDNRSSAAAG